MKPPLLTDFARNALVKAAMDGVPQAYGALRRGHERCALGVLYDAMRGAASDKPFNWVMFDTQFDWCPACARLLPATDLVAHCNDGHKWDFLKIARLLGGDA